MKSLLEDVPAATLARLENGMGPPPSVWAGFPVDWAGAASPEPVLIERFAYGSDRIVNLVGRRFDLDPPVLVDGRPFGGGHFLEYWAFPERNGKLLDGQRLLQGASVTFSGSDEPGDYVTGNPALLTPSPIWRDSASVMWPTEDGEPMFFVGQVDLVEGSPAQRLLTWNVTLYVFAAETESGDRFKLVQQELDAGQVEVI